MKGYQSEINMIQNLKDANCDEHTIGQFMEALQSGKKNQGVQLLQKHRGDLAFESCEVREELKWNKKIIQTKWGQLQSQSCF